MGPYSDYPWLIDEARILDDAKEKFYKGYLQELGYAPAWRAREDSHSDFDHILDTIKEYAREAGYEDGLDRGVEDSEVELRQLSDELQTAEEKLEKLDPRNLQELAKKNRELVKEAADAKRNHMAVLINLSYKIGALMDTTPVDLADIEAWSYQDGRNGVILEIMEYLEKNRKGLLDQ